MENIVTVQDSDFDTSVLKSNKLVLVLFLKTTDSCPKDLWTELEKVAEEYKDSGKIALAKTNLINCATIVKKYQIRVVPYLMCFKDGTVVAQQAGLTTRTQIKSMIKRCL